MLGQGDVHVWRFRLDCSPEHLRTAADYLAADERNRVARFRFADLRAEATAARGLLRSLLGRYLGIDPAHVVFAYGPQGKPYLAGQALQFNLAHSGGLGVCALTLDRPIGVDAELIRADLDYAEVGRRSFSANEQAALASLGLAGAVAGFFRCWARKEAYIKGRGGGLSIPLDSFDVPLGDTPVPQPISSREATPAASGWFMRELALGPSFSGAVAVRANDWRLDDRGWLTLDDAR